MTASLKIKKAFKVPLFILASFLILLAFYRLGKGDISIFVFGYSAAYLFIILFYLLKIKPKRLESENISVFLCLVIPLSAFILIAIFWGKGAGLGVVFDVVGITYSLLFILFYFVIPSE